MKKSEIALLAALLVCLVLALANVGRSLQRLKDDIATQKPHCCTESRCGRLSNRGYVK